MRSIIYIGLKDLRLLARDKFAMFWVLAFPLLMALFFGSIFSFGSGSRAAMKIAIVDQDNSQYTKDFTEKLSNSASLKVQLLPEDSARSQVRRGKLVAFIILKEGIGSPLAMFNRDDKNMVVGIDPSRKAEGAYLQGMIMEAYFYLLQKDIMDPAGSQDFANTMTNFFDTTQSVDDTKRGVYQNFFSSLGDFMAESENSGVFESDTADSNRTAGMGGLFGKPKIEYEEVTTNREGPASSWEITFPSSILWALIGCASAFAISIATERSRGTFLRLQLAPISRMQILAGKGLACFFACVSVCVYLLILGKLIFGVRTPDIFALGLAVFATAWCFVGLMMLISVLGKTEEAVGGAGWAIMLVMAMSGGGMVPLMMLPKWMLTISHASPVKWGILAIEGAIWRDFSYAEMATPIIVLLSFGIVFFSTGVLILRKTDR